MNFASLISKYFFYHKIDMFLLIWEYNFNALCSCLTDFNCKMRYICIKSNLLIQNIECKSTNCVKIIRAITDFEKVLRRKRKIMVSRVLPMSRDIIINWELSRRWNVCTKLVERWSNKTNSQQQRQSRFCRLLKK